MIIRSHALAVVLAALPLVLLAAACGGRSTASGEKLVDPAQADTLAHQALLSENDLPGTGWTVSKTDKFNDAGPGTNTSACKDIAARETASHAKSDPNRAGRAEKEIQDDTEGPIPTAVESQVDVFKDAATPADSLKAFQDALKTSNFETCLKDTLNAGGSNTNTKIATKSVAALTSAPAGGLTAAYDFTFTTEGQSFVLHYETYLFRYANLGVTVTIDGLKADVTADLAKAAITKMQAHLDALPKR